LHECSFDLVVGEVFILPQLTSLTFSKLHLLVEFKTTFSTAGLGLLMGCVGLITRNVMLINNTIYFLLLLFSGANIRIENLPKWMQVVSKYIPLTRGITSTRMIVNGAGLNDVRSLLLEEILIGIGFSVLGFVLFSTFETKAKKIGTLEIF